MARPNITSVDLKYCFLGACQQNQTDGNLITKWSAGGRIVLSWSHQFTLSDPEPPHLPAYDYTPGKRDGSTYILNFSIGVTNATVFIQSSLAFNLTYSWGAGSMQAPSPDNPHESARPHAAYIVVQEQPTDGNFLDITISAVPGGHVDIESDDNARHYYSASSHSTATVKRRVTFDEEGPLSLPTGFKDAVVDFKYLMTAAPSAELTTISWMDVRSELERGTLAVYRMEEGNIATGLSNSGNALMLQLVQNATYERRPDKTYLSSFTTVNLTGQSAFFKGPNLYSFEFNIVDTVGNHRLLRRLALFADNTGVQVRAKPIEVTSAGRA
jgi:hypothetical protein